MAVSLGTTISLAMSLVQVQVLINNNNNNNTMSHSINNTYEDINQRQEEEEEEEEEVDSNVMGVIIATPESSHGGTSPLIPQNERDGSDAEYEAANNDNDNNDDDNNTNKRKNNNIRQGFKDGLSKVKSINRDDLKLDTSKYLKSIIYGGMDGLVSIFVSVAVVASGDAPISVLLVIAVAKLIAGAISMGMGDYLGTQADVDFAKGERQRETWEVEYYIEGEKKEMVEIYCEKGIPEEIATEVVNILATNTKGFVDVMMVEELGITPDAEGEVAWKNGMVNFVSFLIFGIIPLLPYLVYLAVASVRHSGYRDNLPTFISVIGVAIVTLFGMGIFKAKSTQTSLWKNGLSTVFFGCIGAGAGIATVEIIKAINPDIDING
ncbi:transmembrane protein [Cavenderia fasciculata]|uniref:Transmembrane protein n=1 Tax=Cavenderia fasciculata TaxID=261658 RepID=F4PHL7_CACFS|nr:uncharacterized protein DFA_03449 [Cavenderia fasciculata]EGG25201.1 transmembrane protein [Cavenderia fasciculata]|eukprot:XP_004363052.1 transmembrane protein [Cavenderia fasciculata]